jgi:leucyl aminopeptidase
MKFEITHSDLVSNKVDALILPLVQESKSYPGYFREIDAALNGAFSERLEELDYKAEPAKLVSFPTQGKIGAKHIYVIGLGKAEDFNTAILLKAYATAVRKAAGEKVKRLGMLYLENELLENFFQTSVEGILLGAYKFEEYKTSKNEKSGKFEQKKTVAEVQTVQVYYLDKKLSRNIERQIELAQAYAEGTNLARDLVNRPAADLYPEVLAKVCLQNFKSKPFSIKVMDEAEIKKEKMFAFLSVAHGSPKPPRFIHMRYQPTTKAKKRIVLIGKGVTFDTGGLSLKPPRYMIGMKGDMAGAAAVIGVFKALATLKPNIQVDGIIASTENIIGLDSTRPGDVVYARSGKSIEVLNTDAEGRLTLADALDYACELPGVSEIIDLATLTGAQVVATGDLICAGMTNNDAMFAKLRRAGEMAGEKMWQLPLAVEYKDYIKGDIADIKNMGPEGGGAGTILGGLFLQEFVTCDSWVHLDIAGPAFNDHDLVFSPKGGSGFGVRTLLNYLSIV